MVLIRIRSDQSFLYLADVDAVLIQGVSNCAKGLFIGEDDLQVYQPQGISRRRFGPAGDAPPGAGASPLRVARRKS